MTYFRCPQQKLILVFLISPRDICVVACTSFVKNRIICPWFLADRPVFVQAQMYIFKGRSTTQADAYTKAELK